MGGRALRKSQREALRARAEGRQQYAREVERNAQKQKAQSDEKARVALTRHEGARYDKTLAHLDAATRNFVRSLETGPPPGRKLICREMMGVLERLAKVTHLREVKDWSPQGKSRDTLFRSLCNHLLAKYPTPPFLWSVFDENDANANVLGPLVVHVAGGGSLFQYCKSGKVPFALTRAECLEFMKTPADMGIVAALRRVQVKSEGGDHRLYEVWHGLERSKSFGTPEEEAFLRTVLRFFARNPMLSRVQIGPVCDYVFRRFRQDPAFSMQGRTVAAVTRAMEDWHRELGIERRPAGLRRTWVENDAPPVTFQRSGIRGYRVERDDAQAKRNGFSNVIVYTIQEVLTSDALREEGRKLHHCVYSYRSEIVAGAKSIWSLSVADELTPMVKLVTIEVNNKTKAIVQARGACNRMPKANEDRIIIDWASKNGLSVTYGRAW